MLVLWFVAPNWWNVTQKQRSQYLQHVDRLTFLLWRLLGSCRWGLFSFECLWQVWVCYSQPVARRMFSLWFSSKWFQSNRQWRCFKRWSRLFRLVSDENTNISAAVNDHALLWPPETISNANPTPTDSCSVSKLINNWKWAGQREVTRQQTPAI